MMNELDKGSGEKTKNYCESRITRSKDQIRKKEVTQKA